MEEWSRRCSDLRAHARRADWIYLRRCIWMECVRSNLFSYFNARRLMNFKHLRSRTGRDAHHHSRPVLHPPRTCETEISKHTQAHRLLWCRLTISGCRNSSVRHQHWREHPTLEPSGRDSPPMLDSTTSLCVLPSRDQSRPDADTSYEIHQDAVCFGCVRLRFCRRLCIQSGMTSV